MPTDTLQQKGVVCGHAVNGFIALVLTIEVIITAIDDSQRIHVLFSKTLHRYFPPYIFHLALMHWNFVML
jgi:hypothetical protein